MLRTRLTTDPVPGLLTGTNSTNLDLHGEDFLLKEAIARYGFEHWRAHMFSFFGWYPEPNYHVEPDRFSNLRSAIAEGLIDAAYDQQAKEVCASLDEASLNQCLTRQYTAEGPLYVEVNRGLRAAHSNAVHTHVGLVPWILQFNSMLRLRPASHELAYRGTNLTSAEIDDYRIDEFFVWASFVSASRSRDACLGGNVLFELRPWGSYSHYEKRDSRDISQWSIFPEEEEIVFPLCCAFRVREKKHLSDGVTVIAAEVVDSY